MAWFDYFHYIISIISLTDVDERKDLDFIFIVI